MGLWQRSEFPEDDEVSPNSIEGRLTIDGKPASAIYVSFISSDVLTSSLTDEQGRYSTLLPAGSYRVYVTDAVLWEESAIPSKYLGKKRFVRKLVVSHSDQADANFDVDAGDVIHLE